MLHVYPEDPCMVYIFTYIWLIFMGNVGKYTIHGFSGIYEVLLNLYSYHIHVYYTRKIINIDSYAMYSMDIPASSSCFVYCIYKNCTSHPPY